MLELDVHNADGKKVDSLRIDEAVFGGEVNRPLLREAILMHRANSRTGTASAKGTCMGIGHGHGYWAWALARPLRAHMQIALRRKQ